MEYISYNTNVDWIEKHSFAPIAIFIPTTVLRPLPAPIVITAKDVSGFERRQFGQNRRFTSFAIMTSDYILIRNR